MANSPRIDELQKKFEENPRRYFAPLANEYRKGGDPDQAIAICREFLPQQPGHMSGHIVYGQALFDSQQFEEARTVFDTALTIDPENLIALRQLGDIARQLNDPDSARTWYQRVLDADPRNDEIAGILTELGAAPDAEVTSADTGPTGTVVMNAFSFADLHPSAGVDTPDAVADERTLAPEAAPFVEPEAVVEDAPVVEETPAVEEEPVVSEPPVLEPTVASELPITEVVRAVRMETPPHVEVPAAPPRSDDELLDISDLEVEPEIPVAPRISVPRLSLQSMGVEIERADDDSFVPSALDAAAVDDDYSLSELPDPTPAPQADPFATDTMAELYLKQGHYADALKVYRQMLADRPDDTALEAKILELEAREASGDPLAEAQEVPDLDASAFDAALAEPEAVFEPSPVPERVAAVSGAPSIREFLATLAGRSLSGATPASDLAAFEVVDEPTNVQAEPPVEQEAPAPRVEVFVERTPKDPPPSVSPGGSIDGLFGGAGVSFEDQDAASTLAGAFGAVEEGAEVAHSDRPSMSGAPARRATEELSLDSVFREQSGEATPDHAGFSFDRFFAGGTPASESTGAETPPHGGGSESPDDDIEHFNSWLDGLKKR